MTDRDSSALKTDLAIIGGGPAGISVALHLLAEDPSWRDRLVIVEAAKHPRNKLCGGGVTHYGEAVLERLGLEIPDAHIRVKHAQFQHRNRSFTVTANPLFRVFDRALFDSWLVDEARKRGVTILENEPLAGISLPEESRSGKVVLETAKRKIEASAVVAADGANSPVRRLLRWGDPTRLARLIEIHSPGESEFFPGANGGVAGFHFNEMREGLQGYYWDFPMVRDEEKQLNRGVFDSRFVRLKRRPSPKKILNDALRERDLDPESYPLKGHPIRWFHPKSILSKPRVLLVGDAAGADPLMGEGISFALGYGRPAARSIDRGFKNGNLAFDDYASEIRKEALFRHLKLRTTLARIAYTPRPAWVTDLLWSLTGFIAKRTSWNDSGFEPLKGRRAQKYLE